MAKAPPLTIIITIVGIYLLWERKYIWLLPLMFAFVWTYSLFPMLFIAAFIWTVIIAWNERRFEWRPLVYTGIGLVLGNIINPYFPHNLMLFLEHFKEKFQFGNDFAVSVGGEWYPYNGLELMATFPISLLAMLLGYILFMMKVGNKDLPKEQRDAIIAQARKILLLTPGRDKKIAGLSMLAAQVAKAGDRELADQIMKDAEGLVNPQPKNYQDFLLTWMLASGYASANPDKAFPLLQDTIARANDTLAAFVKAAEFIDVNGEIIEDGEVQVGAFGGSMVRDMTRELNMADSTIRVLAVADFDKTRDLTNRFDRQEVRILAKMLVLRAVLGDKNPPKSEGVDTDPETYLK